MAGIHFLAFRGLRVYTHWSPIEPFRSVNVGLSMSVRHSSWNRLEVRSSASCKARGNPGTDWTGTRDMEQATRDTQHGPSPAEGLRPAGGTPDTLHKVAA